MKTTTITLVEPSKENIEAMFKKINEYAESKGYQVIGELALPKNMLRMTKAPEFESKCQMKKVRSYLTTLDKGVSMQRCNRFLHLLFKRVYKLDTAPKVDYSEKELQIKASRKAWKKADEEAMKLLKQYKEIKGDFYKKK